MRMMRTILALALVAACGDVDTSDDASQLPATDAPASVSPEPVPAELDVSAVTAELAEWRVALSNDSIPAGVVSFEVRNAGTMTHRFEIEGEGQEWETGDLEPGGDVTMSLSLAPGTYEVSCPIEDGETSHEDRGMKAVLRVY